MSWTALASAGLSAAGTGLSSKPLSGWSDFSWSGKDLRRNFRYQKKLMKFQAQMDQNQTAWSLANSPRLEKQGMKNAGINPLLAYNSVGAGAMTVGSGSIGESTEMSGFGDVGASAQEGLNIHSARSLQKKQEELVDKQIQGQALTNENIAANTDKTRVETDKTGAETLTLNAQLPALDAQSRLNSAKSNLEYDSIWLPGPGRTLQGQGVVRVLNPAYKEAFQNRLINEQQHSAYMHSVNRQIAQDAGAVVTGAAGVYGDIAGARAKAAAGAIKGVGKGKGKPRKKK